MSLMLFLEKKLSPAALARLRRAFSMKQRIVLRGIATSGWFCTIYYTFFSRAFRREQQAVATGLALHHSRDDQNSRRTLLRRNIHRIEKGLLMRPRRDRFALSYIVDTVNCYKDCSKADCAAYWAKDLAWAHDILERYFAVVTGGEQAEQALTIFLGMDHSPEGTGGRITYSRRGSCPVPFENFADLARRRRSVRWFLQTPVPRVLTDRAVEVAAEAPTACNRQPFFYRFFDEPETLKQLRPLPLGTAGFGHNIPMLCAVIGDLSAYNGERDRHGIYVDASLSIMTLMYALETLGLSSCPLNWSEIESLERRAEKLLSLKMHERIVMFIAIGYPDPQGLVAFSQKKALHSLRSYNQPTLVTD